MTTLLARCWSQHQGHLHHYLRRQFPGASVQAIEDASSRTALDLLRNPSALEGCATDQARLGLMQCVAWRHLRGELRLKRSKLEQPRHALPPVACPPGQEHLACLAERYEAVVAEACARHGGGEPELLRAALEHLLLTGDTDTAVARRFGLRREPINRAKRLVQRRVVGS
ncbi:MAG: hypothetical protein H6741_26665 [Alphaproteobacteria bacterium]|nr:hypothetical protein [Alphaproteobacteria bacterium]